MKWALPNYWRSNHAILAAGLSMCKYLQSIMPASRPASRSSGFSETGILWITEYTITCQGRLAYTVSIMEFRNGKVVHETQYFGDPFEARAWRTQWVQQTV
jgi:hypothetical protein